MTIGASIESRHVITLVLRLWHAEEHRRSAGFRVQATHVQTGEVAYFLTIEDVAHHLERLADGLIGRPIDFSEARQRSNSNG